MKSQYEKIVRLVCGDNWHSDEVSADERDGGFGVAICLAILQGCRPKISEISETIGCPPYMLEYAFKRLQMNRVFAMNSPVLSDPQLLMHNANTDEEMMSCIRAWCNVAGLASGFVGVGMPRTDNPNNRRMAR